MLVRMRLGQYSRLGLTSQTSSLVSTALSLLFIMFSCWGPCSLASLMIYLRTWVLIILERDLQRSLSYREWMAVSTTDLLIPLSFSRLNSMLSKPALIWTTKDLMHFPICWSSTLSLQNYLMAASTVVVMIFSNSQLGFGMQKATIVRKGSSKVYSFLRKLMPQKMKLNLKGNSFWQAEQKEGRNISLSSISQMLSMKMQRLSSYSTMWGLEFKSFLISLIHESRLRGCDSLSNSTCLAARYLLSSTLKSLRKLALLLARVQLISMKGDLVQARREWMRVVLPEAFCPYSRNDVFAFISLTRTSRFGNIALNIISSYKYSRTLSLAIFIIHPTAYAFRFVLPPYWGLTVYGLFFGSHFQQSPKIFQWIIEHKALQTASQSRIENCYRSRVGKYKEIGKREQGRDVGFGIGEVDERWSGIEGSGQMVEWQGSGVKRMQSVYTK